jgi:hypothetical protein
MLALIRKTSRGIGQRISSIPAMGGWLICIAVALSLSGSHRITKRLPLPQTATPLERQKPFTQAIAHERMEEAIYRQINKVRLQRGIRPLQRLVEQFRTLESNGLSHV